MKTAKPNNIDEYISGFPKEKQVLLEQIRSLVKQTVPEAEEVISYDMPSFKLNGGYVLHFAAFKNHIGIYPAPTGIAEFETVLSEYKSGKGSMQLPLNKPLPTDLIVRIIKHNMARTLAKSEKKSAK